METKARKLLAGLFVLLLIPLFSVVPPALAEDPPLHREHEGKSADEVAKELANPNNSIAKLTFKNQYRWYTGDLPDADKQDNYTLLFQPVFPFKLTPRTEGVNSVLFVRPAFPFVFDQPVPTVDAGGFDYDKVSAMGDIVTDFAYGETHKNGFLWAAGVVSTLPTATDEKIAGKQLRAGPEAVLARITKTSLIGLFPSHQWDVTGWSDSGYFSQSSLQAFLTFMPGGGWVVGTQPTFSYDWKSEEWTVPLHLTVSKTELLGGRPWKFEVEVNYYVDQPDAFGPEWMVSLNVTPIVENFIAKWVHGL